MPNQVNQASMKTHMDALSKDITSELTRITKGHDVRPASLGDLRRWLEAAVKSPTDDVKHIQNKKLPAGSKAPMLTVDQQDEMLQAVGTRVHMTAAANSAIKGANVKKPTAAELRKWVNDALVETATEMRLTVTEQGPKGNTVRPATKAEIQQWLKV